MKFLIFNGSLKPDAESNTFSVCKMLQLAFEKLGHECDIVTLRDLDYKTGTKDIDDELKPHIMKIFDMDGIVLQHLYGGEYKALTYSQCLKD